GGVCHPLVNVVECLDGGALAVEEQDFVEAAVLLGDGSVQLPYGFLLHIKHFLGTFYKNPRDEDGKRDDDQGGKGHIDVHIQHHGDDEDERQHCGQHTGEGLLQGIA